jgi:hypothetical protein
VSLQPGDLVAQGEDCGQRRVYNGGMATSEQPDAIDVRIETGQPGSNRLSIHITPESAEEIAVAFEDEGAWVTRDIIELSVPELIQSALEVAGPVAATGVMIAKILKEWWHRNDAKKVTVTFNGESLSLEGMSVEEMAQIIDKARGQWDDRWRQRLPDRFPSEDEASE